MDKQSEDRRIRRTRQLLQDALLALILEKGYDKLTVQDVIDRANVGRSTFYAHFQDKEDLLLSGFEHWRTRFEEHLLKQPADSESPWALSLSILRHAQHQRPLYKALAGKQRGNVALAHIQKYLSVSLRDHLKLQLAEGKSDVPLEIMVHYIATSFISLLAWWLDNDAPYSAEQMIDFYRRLVQPGIGAILSDHP